MSQKVKRFLIDYREQPEQPGLVQVMQKRSTSQLRFEINVAFISFLEFPDLIGKKIAQILGLCLTHLIPESDNLPHGHIK